jgi:hypothetical protein
LDALLDLRIWKQAVGKHCALQPHSRRHLEQWKRTSLEWYTPMPLVLQRPWPFRYVMVPKSGASLFFSLSTSPRDHTSGATAMVRPVKSGRGAAL